MTSTMWLIIALPLAAIVFGVAGYVLGRYHAELVDKIRTLAELDREAPPEPEKPTVVMGAYAPETPISAKADKRAAGLVETKTPNLLEWEEQIKVENEVLGRGK